jgi:hypothetical protein
MMEWWNDGMMDQWIIGLMPEWRADAAGIWNCCDKVFDKVCGFAAQI